VDKHGFPKVCGFFCLCAYVTASRKGYREVLHLLIEWRQFYDFFIVNDGLDRRNSMLRPSPRQHRRKSSAATVDTANGPSATQRGAHNGKEREKDETLADAMDSKDEDTSGQATQHTPAERSPAVVGGPARDEMDGITASVSALSLVPPSIRFGRGKGRGGLARR
jgi:hypothetical protein